MRLRRSYRPSRNSLLLAGNGAAMRKGIAMVVAVWFFAGASLQAGPRNILWIYVDDMSDWMGCYGHDAVPTPHIDALAEEGVLFERAYMPSPVCSTTRSALITGTIQTTFGLHQHRTMIKLPLPKEVLTVPELFREAGYTTFNESKDDYNFLRDRELLYSGDFARTSWKGHMLGREVGWLDQLKKRTPFFGQIQLKGGKFEGETGQKYPMPSRVSAEEVSVPPYYPDDEVIRNAIARHYEQVVEADEQVGAITAALQEHGLWETTVIFFFTDHGSPLPRSKQFLYEEGLKVPLIVRGPGIPGGERRSDLVSGIDISTTSLSLAGIPIPSFMEGRALFAPDHEPRDYVISARDRCGIAVDRIRTVRTERFRYLRNYQTDRAFYQAQYRDRHASIIRLRALYAEGKLTDLQAAYHEAEQRPREELYDLENDPDQVVNLAGNPEYASVLEDHQTMLADWATQTGDQGSQPESMESLRLVYDGAKGKVEAPEFDPFRQE
ncbi:MAG: sulfatase [Verrucomicrobiota bacterium]